MARCRAYVSSSVAFLRLCVSCWCSSCMAPCPMALLTWLTAVLFRGGAHMTTHQPRMLEQLAFAVLHLDQGSGREHHDAVQSHSGCLGCLSAISYRSEPSCEVIAVSSGLYKTSSRALLDQTSHHQLTHSQHSTTTLNLHSRLPSFTNHHQQSRCLPPAPSPRTPTRATPILSVVARASSSFPCPPPLASPSPLASSSRVPPMRTARTPPLLSLSASSSTLKLRST